MRRTYLNSMADMKKLVNASVNSPSEIREREAEASSVGVDAWRLKRELQERPDRSCAHITMRD